MDSSKEDERASYRDLLISVLKEHEESLHKIVERMEKISQRIPEAVQRTDSTGKDEDARTVATAPKDSETLVFLKIKTSRSIDEIVKIINTLKE